MNGPIPPDPECPLCDGEGVVEDQEGYLEDCPCTEEEEALAA